MRVVSTEEVVKMITSALYAQDTEIIVRLYNELHEDRLEYLSDSVFTITDESL